MKNFLPKNAVQSLQYVITGICTIFVLVCIVLITNKKHEYEKGFSAKTASRNDNQEYIILQQGQKNNKEDEKKCIQREHCIRDSRLQKCLCDISEEENPTIDS